MPKYLIAGSCGEATLLTYVNHFAGRFIQTIYKIAIIPPHLDSTFVPVEKTHHATQSFGAEGERRVLVQQQWTKHRIHR